MVAGGPVGPGDPGRTPIRPQESPDGGGDGLRPPVRRRRRWRWAALAVLVAIVAAGGTVIGLRATGTLTPSHPVPSLVGVSQAAAAQRLAPLHLRLAVSGRTYDAHAPAGSIISQRPASGQLKEGSTVAVTLSLGPRPVSVPNVVGLQSAAASTLLSYLGLRPEVVGHTASMTVPAGAVVSSNPNHGTLLPGQPVSLVVSTGKPTVSIPSLEGANAGSFAAAQAALEAVHLTANEATAYSDTVPPGEVIGTNPSSETVLIVGSQVTVVVSKGPRLVSVPNVRGESVGAASQTLSNDGFQVSGVTGNPIATVTGTAPSSGAVVRFGSAVQIITG